MNPQPIVDFSYSFLQLLSQTEQEISEARKYDNINLEYRYRLLYSYYIDLSQFMDETTIQACKKGFGILTKEAEPRSVRSMNSFINHYDDLNTFLKRWKEENKQKFVKR